MRVFLVLVLIGMCGASAYGYFDLRNGQRKLEDAETSNAKARQTLGQVCDEYASAPKVTRALDNLQGQINKVRADVGQIAGNYAVASKVDSLLAGIGKDIAALKQQLNARTNPASPTYVIEIGFQREGESLLLLRYAGPTIEQAVQRPTSTRPGMRLGQSVKVNPGDARIGTAEFNHAVVRSAEGMRTITLGQGKARPVGMFRANSTSSDWDLGADGRQVIVAMLK
ncbi:MAG: hypothetical protein FJ271_16030 [Planctomycetes bacterium]|nr:hypothetical protein [Planctomycetota bacterium]